MSDAGRPRPAKRAADVVLAAAGLLVLLPLLAAVALLIRLRDPGPVFFRQERVGRGGRTFRIWKFRTMRTDAAGVPLTVGRDPRITALGHTLRRTKLDELPQLWNVLRGDMSLVGPRPEVPRYVALYTPAQRRVLALRPGITDPASLRFLLESDLLGGSDDPERLYVEQVMPEKIRMNLEYAERATLATDAALLVRTVLGIVLPRRTPAAAAPPAPPAPRGRRGRPAGLADVALNRKTP